MVRYTVRLSVTDKLRRKALSAYRKEELAKHCVERTCHLSGKFPYMVREESGNLISFIECGRGPSIDFNEEYRMCVCLADWFAQYVRRSLTSTVAAMCRFCRLFSRRLRTSAMSVSSSVVIEC